jgi:hypothetical protein
MDAVTAQLPSNEPKPPKPSWFKRVWPGPKLIIEGSQLLATICGAFVGLCVTFTLNSEKTDRDKKNHLLSVLGRYELANLDYHQWVGNIDALVKAGHRDTANMVFWKGVKGHPYPYFESFKDPALFEVTPITISGMQFQDYQVKVLFELIRPERY